MTSQTTITQEQLEARIDARKDDDMFGFEWHQYVPYLEHARLAKYVNEGTDLSKQPAPLPIDRAALLVKMRDYMSFAFGKAHNKRGISASRSVQHYIAWTWLVGDDELSSWLDKDENYEPYGLPALRKICEHYGWDAKGLGDREMLGEERGGDVDGDEGIVP